MTELFLARTEAWKQLESMLDRAGRADELTVCSFAMSEGFARRLVRERRRIGKLIVILDFTIATRKRAQMLFFTTVADELYLCNTHAKLIFVESECYTGVCALSANATMNYRYECGIVSDELTVIEQARQNLETMKHDGQRVTRD